MSAEQLQFTEFLAKRLMGTKDPYARVSRLVSWHVLDGAEAEHIRRQFRYKGIMPTV